MAAPACECLLLCSCSNLTYWLALQPTGRGEEAWFSDDGNLNHKALGTFIGSLEDKALKASLVRLRVAASLQGDDQAEVG